jgi:hypothetical protein
MLCFLFVRPVVNICFYVRMRLFMLCFLMYALLLVDIL